MGSREAFDQKVETLRALRDAPRDEAARELRRALKERNNFLVSKAAAVAAELGQSELIPDLAASMNRFFEKAEKSDPQCWAKIGLVNALRALGHRDPAAFLRGLTHVQLEPVWGGVQDSAAPLRSACLMALVDCEIDDLLLLRHLVDRFGDAERSVRTDAARAIAIVDGPEADLLLRLKAIAGDADAEVTGQCLAGLLRTPSSQAALFVARFLDSENEELCIEAVSALGQSRAPEAVDLLQRYWERRLSKEARRAVLLSLGASPMAQAAEFLLDAAAQNGGELRAWAIEALRASRYHESVQARLEAILASTSSSNSES